MKHFMPHATVSERLRMLQENAAKTETTTYRKPLSEDDLAARREDLAENCINLDQLADELKESKAMFKARIDPLKNNNRVLLAEIKTKQTSVTGDLFHLANFDEGMMETYDQEGNLISERRLRPEEKQQNIFSISKTA